MIFKRSEFTITSGQLIAVAIILLLTWINCKGVREGKLIQNLFTLAKTFALIALIGMGADDWRQLSIDPHQLE